MLGYAPSPSMSISLSSAKLNALLLKLENSRGRLAYYTLPDIGVRMDESISSCLLLPSLFRLDNPMKLSDTFICSDPKFGLSRNWEFPVKFRFWFARIISFCVKFYSLTFCLILHLWWTTAFLNERPNSPSAFWCRLYWFLSFYSKSN